MTITIQTETRISENERKFGNLLARLRKGVGGDTGIHGRAVWLLEMAAQLNDPEGPYWGEAGQFPISAPVEPTEDEVAIAAGNQALKARWDRFYAALTTAQIPLAAFDPDGNGQTDVATALAVVKAALESFDDAMGLLQIQAA